MERNDFLLAVIKLEKLLRTKDKISDDPELFAEYYKRVKYVPAEKMDLIVTAILEQEKYFPKISEFTEYIRAVDPHDFKKTNNNGPGVISEKMIYENRCCFTWQHDGIFYACGGRLDHDDTYYCKRCEEIDRLYRSGALDKIYLTTDGKSIKSFAKKYKKPEPEVKPEIVEIDDLPF